MGSHQEQERRIEDLNRLLARLIAPELTLGEAKSLHEELFGMLGPRANGAASGSNPVGPGGRSIPWR